MRPTCNAVATSLLRRRALPILKQTRAISATKTRNAQQTVQTPVQSQNTDDVAAHPLQSGTGTSQVQTPLQTQDPSSIIPKPAQQARPRSSNAGPLYTFWGLMVITPIISYFYYQHRKEHMDQKRARLIAEAQEKYMSRG